jgi:hypothetical protein
MALQYVGSNTGTWAGANTGNNNVSLTALTGGLSASAAIGDIVVALYVTGSTADRTLSITDGTNAYTLVNTEQYSNGTTYDTNLRVAYKILTAADANTVFGPTGNNTDAGAAIVHVWRGINTATTLDVAAVPATGTATGRPDPASISPTTAGTIVLVAGGGAAATGATYTTTDLSNFRTVTSADTNDAMAGFGSFAWSSGTFNPAAFGGGTTNAGDSWAAMTLALRPTVNVTLTPSLYTNTQTFYAPTVSATYSLTPSLYTNTQTFYSATVSTTNSILPDLYTNTQTFYSATVSTTYSLTPSLYTNTQTFYSATITQFTELSPSLYTNTQTFYSATISTTYDVLPNLYTNTQTFYSATVSATYSLTPDLYTNTQTFYSPDVSGAAIYNVSVDETVSADDAQSCGAAMPCSCDDTVTITDESSATYEFSGTTSDSLTAEDTITSTAEFGVSVFDTLAVTSGWANIFGSRTFNSGRLL